MKPFNNNNPGYKHPHPGKVLIRLEMNLFLVWYGIVWYDMVWFGLVWFGLVWFGLVWFGLVWFGLV